MRVLLFPLIIVTALLLVGCVSSVPTFTPEPIGCTKEGKICPDGSVVGRVPPSCEFAPCPIANETMDKEELPDNDLPNEAAAIVEPVISPMPETVFDPNAKPILQNLGVNFSPWNKQTNMAGDFLFTKGLFEDRIFLETGYYVVGNNGPKLLPELTFRLPEKTKIFSPVKGVVFKIDKMYSDDYTIHIQTHPNSQWLVTFEHVEGVTVKQGDTVDIETILGEASTFSSPSGMAFTEITVWKGGPTEKDIIKWCPVALLDPSIKSDLEEKMRQLAQDWESYIGKNVYDEKEWFAPGCLREQLTEYETMNPKVKDQDT